MKDNILIDRNGVTWPLYQPAVQLKLTNPDAKLPCYAKDGDSGADVYSVEDYVVRPGETILVDLGFDIALERGWECQVRSRSGLACKGIVVENSPGTIDAGYRGAAKVIIHNDNLPSSPEFKISKGDRVAQFVVKPTYKALFHWVLDLPPSERGAGGFGSTGA